MWTTCARTAPLHLTPRASAASVAPRSTRARSTRPSGSWEPRRAAGSVGVGVALTKVRGLTTTAEAPAAPVTGTIHKWPKREIKGLLQELKSSEPILVKYLEYATDPWVTDYAELRPLMENRKQKDLLHCRSDGGTADRAHRGRIADQLEAWRTKARSRCGLRVQGCAGPR
ncbi:unnamed protein product [Durusdinium trenchii]|uniref:Uncharacterized protein n=1 Tax=Durusdinium trenchii TaxID=1381693 RepID=A0ABP0T100_9DINO